MKFEGYLALMQNGMVAWFRLGVHMRCPGPWLGQWSGSVCCIVSSDILECTLLTVKHSSESRVWVYTVITIITSVLQTNSPTCSPTSSGTLNCTFPIISCIVKITVGQLNWTSPVEMLYKFTTVLNSIFSQCGTSFLLRIFVHELGLYNIHLQHQEDP